MSKKIPSVKLKRGYTLLSMGNRNIGQWVKTWRYKGIFACHKDLNQWVITHIPTGYGVARLHMVFADVRRMLVEIEKIIDWKSNDPSVIIGRLHGGDFKSHELREVLDKYRKES